MSWDNGYIEHCKIIVVSTTPSVRVKDGFSHLPVLNYCSQPVFS